MKVLKHLGRAVPALAFAGACGLTCPGTDASAGTTQQAAAAKPAYITLELPARKHGAAALLPVTTLSYDAETGVPLRGYGRTFRRGVFIAATIVTAGPIRPALPSGTTFGALTVVETNATRATVRRIDFEAVTVTSVVAAGNPPAQRITLVARSVRIR